MLSSTRHHFLNIPPELRLLIYDIYLSDHRVVDIGRDRQPDNSHLRLLHTCRQVYFEAGTSFRRYVSLRSEKANRAFCEHVDDRQASQILMADVGYGRLEEWSIGEVIHRFSFCETSQS
jgi:hypothetical protein